MSFRKTLCLLVALIFGVSATSFAQVADPRGIRVRFVSPDSAGYAGIGKTIRVNVLRTKTLAPALDSVIVVLRTDTLRSVGSLTVNAAVTVDTINTQTILTGQSGTPDHTRFVKKLAAPQGSSTSVDTFKFTFTVTEGDPENINAVVQAFVLETSGTAFKKLNNLNLSPISDVTGFTDPVGDKKFVRIDGVRPSAGTIFTSVRIDTVGVAKFNAADPSVRSFKIGDMVKIQANVQNFNAAKARVAIYEVGRLASPDSVLYVKDFDAATIVSAAAGVRDSFTLTAGQFKAVIGSATTHTTSNLRAKVVGFLVDNAGNTSLSNAAPGVAGALSPDVTHIFDTTAPTITLTYPDSTGRRFTGLKDTSLAIRLNDGSMSGTSYTLKPLTFKVDEGVTVRWAIAGTDTAKFAGTDSAGVDLTYTTVEKFSASRAQAAGKAIDLSVVVTDSVGNKTTKSVTGVIHDQVAPIVSSLFPSSAALVPDKKINNQTRHPIFRISEVADTISVRYVQVGTTPPKVVTQNVSSAKLTVVNEDIAVTVNDSLLDKEKFSLQVFIRDLAKNVNVTAIDTLTFDKAFNNPVADSFKVVVNEDSVLAGQAMRLTITAIDSKLTRAAGAVRTAVTYNKRGVLVRLVAGTQDLSQVSFWGPGVTDNKNGTANLDAENWVIGERSVWVKSNLVIDNFTAAVEDTSTTIVDGNATKVVNFKGNLDKLWVDAADLRKFVVTAWEGDVAATAVQGDFKINVKPTDSWGNPSLKIFSGGSFTAFPSQVGADSLKLLDTRLTARANGQNILNEILVAFSANHGDAWVPSGPQSVGLAGNTFTAVAPNRSGTDLVIEVRVTGAEADSVNNSKHLQAKGSVTLAFSGIDGPPPTTGAPAAPKNLLVQDYLGASGAGDQGFYVMVNFPKSINHASVSQYRLYRELNVTTGVDANGNVVVISPAVKKWVPWTAIDAVPDTAEKVVRAVVPVTDNVATRWAIASEGGNSSSEAVAAGKRVFTKESVQQMAQFFGVDPNRIVSPETLGQMIVPSADYVKSILGDQKNMMFAALDPDVTSLLGTNAVPTSIRTQGGAIVTSALTAAESAVAAKDNIAPVAVTNTKISGSAITWTASTSDHIVGHINYRGFAIPIDGVTKYEVMGAASQTGTFTLIGTVGGGTTSFTGQNLPSFIRVDALDLDNRTFGPVVQTTIGYRVYRDATNAQVYIVLTPGAPGNTTPYVQDFADFIAFASAFNATEGQPNYILQADTNQDKVINFSDFIAFASSFNKVATTVDGSPVPSTKPVIQNPGVNENSEFSLSLGSDRVLAGQTVTVNVSLANVQALMGYGFALNYDADKFEFVGATPASQDLLKSTGGETPLFSSWNENGKVSVANAVIDGSAISGGGEIVSLTFKVLREFEDQARFEIAEGLVFDPQQLSNPAVVAGVLELQSTPTEFALLQNFPNPFNPETTISYNLAESGDVSLQIYNVVGQVVRTLVAERQSAGRYQVRWNGTDDRGVPVSSGIYFYQITTGKNQDVRKLMLLK